MLAQDNTINDFTADGKAHFYSHAHHLGIRYISGENKEDSF